LAPVAGRAADCFEAMAHDLRAVLRLAEWRAAPSAAILDSRTLRSTPESGAPVGYDGAKRQKGSKLHAAVDTLGHLMALHVTPAGEQDRAQVGRLAAAVREVSGRDAIVEVDGPDSDAVVVVGTNLPMARVAAMAEFWLGKPVIALNAATYWHALRESGIGDRVQGFGRLLGEF
jgi:Transposase DDE domain